MIQKVAFALAIILQIHLCQAQQFDPFKGQDSLYHANMRLFFKSPAIELSSRRLLIDSVHSFEHQGDWTVQNLPSRLDCYENLFRSLELHYQYFRLLAKQNRKDTTIEIALQGTAQAIDVLSAKLDSRLQLPALAHLTPAVIIKNDRLLPYSYLLNQRSQQAIHTLAPSAEKVSSALAGQMLDRLRERYDDLIDTIKPVAGKIASLQTYAKHGELFAATLIDITRINATLATSHYYHNAPEQYYASRLQLSEDSVRAVLMKVAAGAQLLKDYQLLQQQLVRKTGIGDTVHSWDINRLTAYRWHPLLFQDVRRLVNSALAPLGKDYQDHFSRLLDPANGLLDIAYTSNRAGGGNSFGYAGPPIGLFMQGFDGGFRNTSTLIHEGGHAIHRQMMSENHVLPSYASGPNFMSEAFAILNELLLLDELQNQADTKEAKAYYTRLFIDKLVQELFVSAEEGMFEQGLYDGVAAGRINGLQDINSLYAGIMKSYDLFFAIEPERETEWITKRLVFEDPLYNASYLFAMLVTCKLYQLHLQDPAGFSKKYTALLSNGFAETAAISVRRYMGFDLNYTNLLEDALQLMKTKTATLKQLAD